MGQEGLIAAAESKLGEEDLSFLRQLFYSKAGEHGVVKTIRDHNLDVIVAPVDSPVQSVSTGSSMIAFYQRSRGVRQANNTF